MMSASCAARAHARARRRAGRCVDSNACARPFNYSYIPNIRLPIFSALLSHRSNKVRTSPPAHRANLPLQLRAHRLIGRAILQLLSQRLRLCRGRHAGDE